MNYPETTAQTHREQEPKSDHRFAVRRAVAAVAVFGAALGLGKGVEAGVDAFTYETVSETTVGISGNSVNTVQAAINELAEKQGISGNDVSDVIESGQEVDGELREKFNEMYVQPGQKITVTLEKNAFGYRASADPADIPDLANK